jgi:hypothetical protein
MTDPLHIGDHVRDRDADADAATMLVVGRAVEPADEYVIDGTGEDQTVADYNDDYPADDRVVEVVFPKRTDIDVADSPRYAYPQSRLERVSPIHDVETGRPEVR